MSVKIELPEIFVLCSTALFIAGATAYGWTFFSLGVLGSVFRLGLKLQEQQQQATAVKEGVDVLKDYADEFISALNGALSGSNKKTNRNNLN